MPYRYVPAGLLLLCVSLCASPSFAQGPWVPAPGSGYLYSGGSRKAASSIFDKTGEVVHLGPEGCCQNHDFRYAYLTGEVGIVPRLSGSFVLTYLYGLEGPTDHLEKNVGFSDAWFGLKYAVLEGPVPVSLAATLRTPFLYDIDGPYDRHLYNEAGEEVGNSPEWRGLLKHDLTAQVLVGRSLGQGAGWAQGGVGYTWREGAPADAIPVHAEVGHRIPWFDAHVKVGALWVFSQGNFSEREPEDRFGTNPNSSQNLNDQSMGRLGTALLVPFGAHDQFNVELGYNHIVWGRSMRRYQEPYFSVGMRF